jgi:hypothetical protein
MMYHQCSAPVPLILDPGALPNSASSFGVDTRLTAYIYIAAAVALDGSSSMIKSPYDDDADAHPAARGAIQKVYQPNSVKAKTCGHHNVKK